MFGRWVAENNDESMGLVEMCLLPRIMRRVGSTEIIIHEMNAVGFSFPLICLSGIVKKKIKK